MRTTLLPLIGLMALAGCDGPGTSTNPPPSGDTGPFSITNDNYPDLIAGAYCDFLSRCSAEFGPAFSSRSDCVEVMVAALGEDDVGGPFDAKGSTRYTIDSDEASACLDGFGTAPCTGAGAEIFRFVSGCGQGFGSSAGPPVVFTRLAESIPACQTSVQGALAAMECCDIDGGCGPDLYCERQSILDTGTCLPEGALDETCYQRPCAATLHCNNMLMPPVCKALGQVSDPCGGPGDRCDTGLYCDQAGMTPVCATRIAMVSDPCNCGECVAGLICDFSGGPGQCLALVAQNGACLSDSECASGLICWLGTCVPPPSPNIGDECDPRHGVLCPQAAISEGRCDDDGTGTDRCLAPGGMGAPCDPMSDIGEECNILDGLFCDQMLSTCQLLPARDQPCFGVCADILQDYCSFPNPMVMMGTCTQRVGNGQSCADAPFDNILSSCEIGLRCNAMTFICEPENTPPMGVMRCP